MFEVFVCFDFELFACFDFASGEPLVDFAFEEAELFPVFMDGDAVLAYPVVDC